MDPEGYGLTTAIAPLLRLEREKAALTQAQLARRAGTTQQHLSRLEQGKVSPTASLLDRLFDALNLQLRLTVEARDADLDATLDAGGETEDDLAAELMMTRAVTKTLPPEVPFLLDGQLGAALHGTPIKVRRTDLAFAQSDVDKVADWLANLPNTRRWSDKWQDYAPIDRDPRQPGPLRYWTPWCELHLRLLPTLPPPVEVAIKGD
ncbi:helix-turn-helix domain-containing protein, partial [Asanoa siamensis]|uniref:helix-turn-helix domain-containing protein n=1 Tax=Asanoa siamensis TaxID=926357 RepID=UPI0019435C59